ncbi:MAG: gliding motility protein GldC [Lewinellaceae bacterium]|nr:gliding motility protein GldC [Lewinella sp.]MCB9281995.1 gliding motility protein GldC [Lewinellaceae bacterium]
MKKNSKITIQVGLDEGNVPETITWQSDDSPNGDKPNEARGMLLSFFDGEALETLKIDLWTKEMKVEEMDRFMFQTLRALADTYYRATQNAQLATDMQRFVHYFGEQTEIIPKTQG